MKGRQSAMASGFLIPVNAVDVHQLASVIKNRIENVLIIDSRSFIEHNACHIGTAVNVCCSKIVKRRLQQDKLSVKELLMHTCHCDVDEKLDVVVYDQSSKDVESLSNDSFTVILIKKLQLAFRSVNLLAGGFDEFQESYPELCEDKTRKCPPLTSLSQPCLPIANQGPTRILPFLYLGSQFDALNKDLLKDYNITYQLNVSTTCPQPEFVSEGHFMRIPVNDNYSEKLLPYFPEAFNFLDKVREGNGFVLIHCLAGISRSPTVAIAYVMKYLRLTSDDGYRYVKSKRPTISPNFNFLGQLLEYEKQLRKEDILDAKPEVTSAPPLYSKKRLCRTDMRTSKLSLDINPKVNEDSNIFPPPRSGDQSPTTALAKLSFGVQQANDDEENLPSGSDFKQYRSKSCYGDWLRDHEDSMVERKSRECTISTSSKPLSPVKEIKCDALISEISSGHGESTIKSGGVLVQRGNRNRRSEEKQLYNTTSHFFCEKQSCLSDSEEKFSLQTLSHLSTKSSTMFHATGRSKEFQKVKLRETSPFFVGFQQPKVEFEASKRSTINQIAFSEYGNKCACLSALHRSGDLFKKDAEPYFMFHEHTSSSELPSLQTLSSDHDSYTRSDSVETSGFGSESSDCTENSNDLGRKSEISKLEIEIDDLEDDVILRSNSSHLKTSHAINNNRMQFSLALPNVVINEFPQGLASPLSPSESHLLEEIDVDKETTEHITGPQSPNGINHPSEDIESFHDSGVPLSPQWIWPRKRVSSFENNQKIVNTKTFPPSHMKEREFWSLNCNDKYAKKNDHCKTMDSYQSPLVNSKIGLYRAQSCPGILNHASSFSKLDNQLDCMSMWKKNINTKNDSVEELRCAKLNKNRINFPKFLQKEVICYESCPDVSHLGKIESSVQTLSCRQRDFRRNVRMIQVS